jgi:glycosyltransferase involved in cell wall biosynthesis
VHALAFVDAGTEHAFVDELREAGIPLTAVALPPRAYRAERARMLEVARRIGAAVVHTHGTRVDVVDLPAARTAGLATVATLHGFTGNDLKYRFYEWLQCRVMRRADCVVAVSRPIVARLGAAGVRADRIRLVPNAWAPRDEPLGREAARAALGVPVAGWRIGWVGRITREKGPDVMVEAAGRLGDLPLGFSMLGAGRERGSLERRARDLGLGERLTFHGVVPAAGRLMRAFDALVLSSRTEGTPIVLLEALGAGVPVVTTAVGGVPDVVSPAEARLVAPDDPAALANAIREVVTDPAAAASRARAGALRLAAAFGVEPWLDAYEEIYHQVANVRRSAPA